MISEENRVYHISYKDETETSSLCAYSLEKPGKRVCFCCLSTGATVYFRYQSQHRVEWDSPVLLAFSRGLRHD